MILTVGYMFVLDTDTVPESIPGLESRTIDVSVGIETILLRVAVPNKTLSPMVKPVLESTVSDVPEVAVNVVEKELNL